MLLEFTSFGGVSGVTGSKHRLSFGDLQLLLDCGTFQGLPDVRERNRSFPFPPDSISHVILSHAHLDHCGMLPLLVKRGFRGKIFATAATRDVAAHMLLDAANIEVQDASWRARHHVGAPDEREPLFTPDDIPGTMARFVTVPYAREGAAPHEVAPGVTLTMYDAGHILGSAVIVLEFATPEGPYRVLYSGDLGPPGMPLLHDPEAPVDTINTVLLESTYGSRTHAPLPAALERLQAVVSTVIERGGKIIVPAFSLGRTQLLVYLLHKLMDEEKIPAVPVFVDSPLATNLTDVFKEYEQHYDPETKQDFGESQTPFAFRQLTYVSSINESKALNDRPGPFIVISASGMMTAGRVVHHLRHGISDARNAILVSGYQAQGTIGRRLLEGAERVELYGDSFTVRAEIHLFNEFSAHADRDQLRTYLARLKGVRRVILVHGEPEEADALKATLEQQGLETHRPLEGEAIQLQ